VRITHIPSGIVVAIQDERSQHSNRAKAMKLLRARLFERKRAEEAERRADMRSEQVSSAERSDRIRTYNFPQGRVTDHRVNLSKHDIEHVMEGDIDAFHDALVDDERQAAMIKLGFAKS
jgi:peptide chain release factor 1